MDVKSNLKTKSENICTLINYYFQNKCRLYEKKKKSNW